MGSYATKADSKKGLKKLKKDGFEFFEVVPAPDGCEICVAKANRAISIDSANPDSYPPFHDKCRCATLFVDEDHPAGTYNRTKAKYESGELPMKRCSKCNQWIPGNTTTCHRCPKPSLLQKLFCMVSPRN